MKIMLPLCLWAFCATFVSLLDKLLPTSMWPNGCFHRLYQWRLRRRNIHGSSTRIWGLKKTWPRLQASKGLIRAQTGSAPIVCQNSWVAKNGASTYLQHTWVLSLRLWEWLFGVYYYTVGGKPLDCRERSRPSRKCQNRVENLAQDQESRPNQRITGALSCPLPLRKRIETLSSILHRNDSWEIPHDRLKACRNPYSSHR